MQMIRDCTGLNEARDGSMPDKNALVGLQKIAAANSNTATRHVLQSGLFLTAEVAECLSLRISDVIEYSPTKQAFIEAIGHRNVAKLEEISDLHLHDFGIFIDLTPDEEEKQLLENNIQMAIQQKSIEVKNLKLANQLLKLRRSKKQERDRRMQMENIQAQSQSNQQAAQAAAQVEMQKQETLTRSKIQLLQTESELEAVKLQMEMSAKKELMALEFEYKMQLKGIEVDGEKQREKEKVVSHLKTLNLQVMIV